MSQWGSNIAEWILAITGGNPWLSVLIVACIPLIELKGAIPLGQLWGLGYWETFWIAFLGRTLISIPLLLLLRTAFDIGKRWIITRWLCVRIELIFMSKAERRAQGKTIFFKSKSSTLLNNTGTLDAQTIYHSDDNHSDDNIGQLVLQGIDDDCVVAIDTAIDSLRVASCVLTTDCKTDAYTINNSRESGGKANTAIIDDEQAQQVLLAESGGKANVAEPNDGQAQQVLSASKIHWQKFWIIFLFSALPLPMTGVWTSSAVAVFMRAKFWMTFLAILTSNLVDGLLVLLLTYLLGDYLDTFLMVMLGLAGAALILFVYKIVQSERHNRVAT